MKVIKDLNEINDELCIIDFFATWCGPCKMLAPNLEEIEEEQGINVFKIDVDESSDLARKFGITVVPTLFLLKNKKVLSSNQGYLSVDDLIDWINENK